MALAATSSPFSDELERLLKRNGLSWRKLADLVGYTPSWLSKVKNGTPPSAELARLCDQVLGAGGALLALAAVETGTPRPAQLPAAAARFVGRIRQLTELRSVLSGAGSQGTPRMVAVHGPPGAGKTSLALRLAHDVAGGFVDGQLYVNLRGYAGEGRPAEPAGVLEEFLLALGVASEHIPRGIEPRAKLYRSLLAGRSMLIVLDNALDSLQVEALLPGNSDCAVVVTSRKRLAGLAIHTDAHQLQLGPMEPAESVALLGAVIGAQRSTAEPAAITSLAFHCGHLPLALRIAAERVAVHPGHSVHGLVGELEDEERVLDALETDDSVAVRTVFSWSYRDLPDRTARVFRLLGLHPGPHLSVAAAAALTGESPGITRRELDRLAAGHLIETLGDGRYHLHDLLRRYAAEQTERMDSAPDIAAAIRRLTDWYLHSTALANRLLAPYRVNPLLLADPDPAVRPLELTGADALRWCDEEADNFAPITALALSAGLHETCWKLPIALFDYLYLRKPGQLWLRTHEPAIAAAETMGDKFAEGWVRTNLAEGFRWLGEYERCHDLYEQALVLREQSDDRHGAAWVLIGIGALAVNRGQLDRAMEYGGRALELFRALADQEAIAYTQLILGDACLADGRHEDALRVFDESLRTSERLDDHYGAGLALGRMSEVHLVRGDPDTALPLAERSLEARRRAGDRWGEAESHVRLARLLRALDQHEAATKARKAAARIYAELGDPRALLDD
ncbi:hypothetical protein D5S17_15465 [Pseudonocardiaceae bacterium YIM PH 21723]|nr:hypothetical protein D5S17_15465 [Pseudonocardiaceae bacterium YIM PH 21723]